MLCMTVLWIFPIIVTVPLLWVACTKIHRKNYTHTCVCLFTFPSVYCHIACMRIKYCRICPNYIKAWLSLGYRGHVAKDYICPSLAEYPEISRLQLPAAVCVCVCVCVCVTLASGRPQALVIPGRRRFVSQPLLWSPVAANCGGRDFDHSVQWGPPDSSLNVSIRQQGCNMWTILFTPLIRLDIVVFLRSRDLACCNIILFYDMYRVHVAVVLCVASVVESVWPYTLLWGHAICCFSDICVLRVHNQTGSRQRENKFSFCHFITSACT